MIKLMPNALDLIMLKLKRANNKRFNFKVKLKIYGTTTEIVKNFINNLRD